MSETSNDADKDQPATFRILVVDDSAHTRVMLRRALEGFGFKDIVEACDGNEALERLKDESFDLVLADCYMPRLSGIELLRAVRADRAMDEVRFIMVSAESSRQQVAATIEAGVDDFLVKPFTIATLRDHIRRVFSEDDRVVADTPANAGPAENAEHDAVDDVIGLPAEGDGDDGDARSRILVVDDAVDNLQLVVELLKDTHTMLLAGNGSKALEMARNIPLPDLILLDIMMPEMDGYEVCRQLKADPVTRDIPVIFLSALDAVEDVSRGLELGAVDYITKPIEPAILQARVDTHLRLKRARDHLQREVEALRQTARLREDIERMSRHDLIGPLSIITGNVSLLQEQEGEMERSQPLLDDIQQAAEQMRRIVALSLELYKMETGSYRLSACDVDLGEVAIQAAWEVESALGRNVAVNLHYGGRPLVANDRFMVRGDPLLCHLILSNLIRNAVEASDDGREVILDFVNEAQSLVVRIHNHQAVPAQLRGRFFDKYVTYGKQDGNGLGTYSAKLMTDVQGGDLVMHTDEGAGTTLVLSLKRAEEELNPVRQAG